MGIKLLSEDTINKIAAGEVVERPLNAVKELIENSLDADSRNIEIEISGAGRRLIRVRDDGSGMSREDLALAVTRHATSKISIFSDLNKLCTLGFRGEALPSISAVSKLTIQSLKKDSSSGWEVRLSGGKLSESRAWAGSPGTNIEVKDLFYNTPARAKFLKSDVTERHKILRLIEEISLAWPSVAFKIISEGRTFLAAPQAKTDLERAIDVLGKDFTETLIPLEANHPGVSIKAYITRTESSLSSRDRQFFFVNNRPITPGKILTHSLYEAYRENLPVGRHPGVLIFIKADPSEIDVNIHPTKREVRFSKEREIHDFLSRALKGVLSRTPFASVSLPQESGKYSFASPKHFNLNEKPDNKTSFNARFEYPVNKIVSTFNGEQSPESSQLENWNSLRSMGQVFNLYIVAQKDADLIIVDQHAAAERIRYEKYIDEFQKKHITVQGLLLPLTLDLSPSQAGLINENIHLLKETGWEIENFGKNSIRVTAVPAILGTNSEIRDLINAILQALTEDSKIPDAQKLEKIIRTACRTSVKAGDFVSESEINRLLNDLFLCRSPYTCPHGRPTIFRISRPEIEKYFGRK